MSFVHHSYKAVEAFVIDTWQTVTVIARFLCAIPLCVVAGISNCVSTVCVIGLRGSSTASNAAIQATHQASAIITRSSTSAANMVYNLPRSVIEIIGLAWRIFTNIPATVIKLSIGISTAATYGAACTANYLLELPTQLALKGLRATLAADSAISPYAAQLQTHITATSFYQAIRRLADPAVTAVSTSPLFIPVKKAAWALAMGVATNVFVTSVAFFVPALILLLPFFLACLFVGLPAVGLIVTIGLVLGGVFFGGVTVCLAACIAVCFLGNRVAGLVQWASMSQKKVD